MAGQQGSQDPKEAALAEARCLNPHPEQVTDAEFLASDFFDARDAVQVKYEMVRKVEAGRRPGHRGRRGVRVLPPGLLRRGRRAGVLRAGRAGAGPARAARRAASSPRRSAPGPRSSWPPTRRCARRSWPARIEEAFGVRAHPRSIERALARCRERHSKSR